MSDNTSQTSHDWDLVQALVVATTRVGSPEREALARLRNARPAATEETVWAIAYQGDTESPVDEYFEEREHAEETIAEIRASIAGGRYQPADFEPLILMEGTRITYRPTETGWQPVTEASQHAPGD